MKIHIGAGRVPCGAGTGGRKFPQELGGAGAGDKIPVSLPSLGGTPLDQMPYGFLITLLGYFEQAPQSLGLWIAHKHS